MPGSVNWGRCNNPAGWAADTFVSPSSGCWGVQGQGAWPADACCPVLLCPLGRRQGAPVSPPCVTGALIPSWASTLMTPHVPKATPPNTHHGGQDFNTRLCGGSMNIQTMTCAYARAHTHMHTRSPALVQWGGDRGDIGPSRPLREEKKPPVYIANRSPHYMHLCWLDTGLESPER